MNHLSSAGSSNSFSGFRGHVDGTIFVDEEMSSSSAAGNIGGWGGVDQADKFLEDVEGIKDELKEVERSCKQLQQSHEESKTLHNARYVKELRSRMDYNVSATIKKVKLIKLRLQAIEQANTAANLNLPGCGPCSSSDRTRSSVVNGLRKKLKGSMDGFNRLREQISGEIRETVNRRYYTVTGEKPDNRTVEMLISTGDSEAFLHKAIQKQGRGKIVETIWEIQERHDAVKEMERSLEELHHVFLPMVVLLEEQQQQGELQLDHSESTNQVKRANSFVRDGSRQQLQTTSKKKMNIWKWIYIGTILTVIVFVIVYGELDYCNIITVVSVIIVVNFVIIVFYCVRFRKIHSHPLLPFSHPILSTYLGHPS